MKMKKISEVAFFIFSKEFLKNNFMMVFFLLFCSREKIEYLQEIEF